MRHAFRAILEGAPATIANLRAASGLPGPVVEEAVRRLLERGTLVAEAGRITGSRGLSLTEMPHRLVLAGRPHYAFTWMNGRPRAHGRAACSRSPRRRP